MQSAWYDRDLAVNQLTWKASASMLLLLWEVAEPAASSLQYWDMLSGPSTFSSLLSRVQGPSLAWPTACWNIRAEIVCQRVAQSRIACSCIGCRKATSTL